MAYFTIELISGQPFLLTEFDSGGIPSSILTAKGDLITATAPDTPTVLPVGTDGQVLTADSSTATGLRWGSIDVLNWVEETTTSRALAVGEGVIANNAARVDIALPATAAIGDTFAIAGKGSGGWELSQNAGQTVYFGNQSTTAGTGGSLASTHQRDCIHLICVTANNDFQVISSVGNITVT